MGIPSGSGSEVLLRGLIDAQSTTETSLLFTGAKTATGASGNSVPTDHIITMLTVSFCNTTANNLNIYMTITGESINCNIISAQPVAGYSTFVWNDKFVLKAGDDLKVTGVGSGTVDVVYSFIDQNWT